MESGGYDHSFYVTSVQLTIYTSTCMAIDSCGYDQLCQGLKCKAI